MKKIALFVILFLVTTTSLAYKTYLPKTKCSLEDSVCLTEQAQVILQTFVKGIPEHGIPAMDKLSIDPVLGSLDNFIFNWTDVKVGGLKDAVIDKVSVNMDIKTLRILFHTDLLIEFFNSVDGVLLSSIPVYGSGKGDLTLKNIVMELLFLFDITKDENGKDVMDMKKYYYGYYAADSAIANFENLYNGDKKKSERFHKLINENYRIMMFHFSNFFQSKIINKIYDAIRMYMRSRPLEDLALYDNNN